MENLKSELRVDFHRVSVEELCMRFGTNAENGLSEAQYKENRDKYGPNRLTPPKTVPEWVKFCQQLFGGFATLLWVGAILCFMAYGIQTTSQPNPDMDYVYLGAVLVFVVVATGIFTYFQESKSEKVMESFKKLVPQHALVIRNGQKIEVDAETLTVGDIIEVKAGDRVPADIRVIASDGMKVDNSSLTGESEPQSRKAHFTHDNPLVSHFQSF